MKIAQYYDEGHIRLGLIQDDRLLPLDFQGDMIDFIQRKPESKRGGNPQSLDMVTFAPPANNPSKIIAIGLNYKDHITESKGEVPENPIIFAKFPSSLIGHRAAITWDSALTKKVDFEAELAVVIGKRIYKCHKNEAMDAIFGYTCANDVSARDLQFGDRQWVRGKSLDTFCPIGPWIVTPEEIPDPQSLDIRCWLNGQLMQDSNTDMMIFTLPELIVFISEHFTLLPGDILLTGTPHGVGAFREPSVYMNDGDEIAVEIESIGRLVNVCKVA
jgi:2-keto-4-pentenoate hydratase/2-oxohepta-3-ene-1,7-dioic acid hydratase in catechol pathway